MIKDKKDKSDLSIRSTPAKKPKKINWSDGAIVLNPNGAGRKPGIPEPGTRMRYLLEKHGVEVILKGMENKKFLAKTFSSYDAMLIVGFANSINGSDTARESMLNRMFGKVPDKQINLNINAEFTPQQLAQRAQEMLAQLGDDDDDDDED
jgi:hypothetical protein